MSKKLFTKDQERAIVYKYKRGVWMQDLANSFGCSIGCIVGILNRHGANLAKYKRLGSAAKRGKAASGGVTLGKILVLHRDGYSVKDIAKYTRASKAIVIKTINSFIVPIPVSADIRD